MTDTALHLALASSAPAWEDKVTSLAACRALAARAAERGAELLAFPELTLTGFTMRASLVAEDPADSPTIREFAAVAREHGLSLAFGVALHGRERPTNQLVVLDAAGGELARYAKVHPFSLAGEDRSYEAGERAAIATVKGFPLGLGICYDLRFPELFAALAPAAAALLVIANWPAARIEHWYALLQARAIESQCYAIGVNRTGRDGNGFDHPRSSCVFDPAGARVVPDWVDGELDGFRIEDERVSEQRAAFPALRDRRPDVYRRP